MAKILCSSGGVAYVYVLATLPIIIACRNGQRLANDVGNVCLYYYQRTKATAAIIARSSIARSIAADVVVTAKEKFIIKEASSISWHSFLMSFPARGFICKADHRYRKKISTNCAWHDFEARPVYQRKRERDARSSLTAGSSTSMLLCVKKRGIINGGSISAGGISSCHRHMLAPCVSYSASSAQNQHRAY